MTLQSSGGISLSQINAEFGKGNNLAAYHGQTWYTDANASGTFSGGTISLSDFYSKRVSAPIVLIKESGFTDSTSYSNPNWSTGMPPGSYSTSSGSYTYYLPSNYSYIEMYAGCGTTHTYSKQYAGAAGAPAVGDSIYMNLYNGYAGHYEAEVVINDNFALRVIAGGSILNTYPNPDNTTVASPCDQSNYWVFFRVYGTP